MAQHLCGSAENELIVSLLSFGGMAISLGIIARPLYVYIIVYRTLNVCSSVKVSE